MDLNQLGNLGEFVIGVAVVASLIYVGIQIRQNTRATHAATLQELCRDMREQFNAPPVVRAALRKISVRQEKNSNPARRSRPFIYRAGGAAFSAMPFFAAKARGVLRKFRIGLAPKTTGLGG